MSTQYEDFQINQGADFSIELHLVNPDNTKKDLTGFSAEAKMKRTYSSDSADTYTFSTVIATPPTDGVCTLGFTNTQTDVMTPGRYFYDVELSFQDSDANTIIERILEGKIEVKPSVTR